MLTLFSKKNRLAQNAGAIANALCWLANSKSDEPRDELGKWTSKVGAKITIHPGKHSANPGDYIRKASGVADYTQWHRLDHPDAMPLRDAYVKQLHEAGHVTFHAPQATAANETSVTLDGLELSNATEEKPVPDWIEIPFGNHDHRVGMQVFDQGSAEEIIANFKSLGKRSKGIPFYEGHPDVDPARWPDKSAKGWIKDMALSAAGLRLKVAWNSAGQDLVAGEKYAYFSPTWGCLPVAGRSNAYRPIRLRSVGLVNEPNIGVMPLTNEQPKGTPIMPPWLLELLGLPADATEEQLRDAIAAKLTAAQNAALANETLQGAFAALGAILLNEAPEDDQAEDRADFLAWMHELLGTDPATGLEGLKTALADKVTKAGHIERVQKAQAIARLAHRQHAEARDQLETTLNNEQTLRTTAETELANARSAFTTERKMRAELVVANLIGAGKLRKADAEARITELSNAGDGFDALATTLSNAAQVLPVNGSAMTTHLGSRKGESEPSKTVVQLTNERMHKTGEDYRTAFNNVKSEHPALFDAMKQPATATK